MEPYTKSEPIPENNDSGAKVAVAKNFDEIVTNYDGDVLIEFYAEWCGHCKKVKNKLKNCFKNAQIIFLYSSLPFLMSWVTR